MDGSVPVRSDPANPVPAGAVPAGAVPVRRRGSLVGSAVRFLFLYLFALYPFGIEEVEGELGSD